MIRRVCSLAVVIALGTALVSCSSGSAQTNGCSSDTSCVRSTTTIALAAKTSRAAVASSAASSAPCASPTDLDPRAGEGARVPTKHGTIWALMLSLTPPKAGMDLKIVWRVSGSGPLKVTLRNPAGLVVPLAAGPTKHLSSSFQKPGAEYGTVFALDRPGCYTVDLTRAKTKAKVHITAT